MGVYMRKVTFEKWLDSEGLSSVTIGNYIRGIRYTEEKFPHIGTNDKLDIYGIDNLEDIELILQDIDFRDYDKKGNRMCSSGLKKYKEFLSKEILINREGVYVQKNSEDIVLIKINQSYKADMTPEELYRATSISWVGNFKKSTTRDLKYYCAIVQLFKMKLLKCMISFVMKRKCQKENQQDLYYMEKSLTTNCERNYLV